MKRRHTALLILFVIIWMYAQFSQDTKAGSSYSSRGFGTRALLLTLQESGQDTKPWLKPFAELSKETKNTTMFIITPRKPLSAGESLINWVKQGNQAVLVVESFAPIFELSEHLKIDSESIEHEWLERVSREDEPIEVSCLNENECADVETISASTGYYKNTKSDWQTVITLGERSLVLSKNIGEGKVWLFLDSVYFQNNYIDKYDNFRMLLGIITDSQTVYFDEFHHGFTAPAPAESKNRQDAVNVLIGFLIFFIIIGALSRAVRFGPPVETQNPNTSSAVEFAAACGLLYKEHKASSALKYYLQSWQKRAAKSFGLSRRLDTEVMAAELARLNRLEESDATSLANSIKTLTENKNLKDGEDIIRSLENLIPTEETLSTNTELRNK